jgi:hypothetical protein
MVNNLVNCSCCNKQIPEGLEWYIRREWRRRGWAFCSECVDSHKARKWAEKEEEKLRTMK